jgi:hypothetical protein
MTYVVRNAIVEVTGMAQSKCIWGSGNVNVSLYLSISSLPNKHPDVHIIVYAHTVM